MHALTYSTPSSVTVVTTDHNGKPFRSRRDAQRYVGLLVSWGTPITGLDIHPASVAGVL